MKSVPRDHQAFRRNLAYAHHPGQQLLLDVYRPDVTHDVPAVLYFHAGGWRAGSKDHCLVRWLVRYGLAVVPVNYRLVPRYLFPDQIHDAKAAVRYIRAHAEDLGLIPDQIAAAGASSGAHLACLLGLTAGNADFEGEGEGDHPDVSSEVNAVVNYFAPTDFLRLQRGRSKLVESGSKAPEARLLGHAITEDTERSQWASPLTYVKEGAPPFLHVHGELDDFTPLEQTRSLHAALESEGSVSKLLLVRGAGHGGRMIFDHRSIRDRVASFLLRHMGE
ncbi:MAG: alpha/beta hydrolase [Algisphaera sp.]